MFDEITTEHLKASADNLKDFALALATAFYEQRNYNVDMLAACIECQSAAYQLCGDVEQILPYLRKIEAQEKR